MSTGRRMSGHCDFGGDAAAYVLGALEPSEADAFREHLEQCAACREEIEALAEVAQALAMAAPQHPLSRRLRRRVLRAVREESRTRPVALRRWRPASAWSKPRGALAAVAAAVVVALAVVGGLTLSGAGGNGGAKVIHAQLTGISGHAELRIVGSRAELIVHHLTPPPPGHVYQVWLKPPHAPPQSASVLFSVGSDGSADVGLPADLRGISQVMVTPEPAGGSVVPTHAPVIVASLS